MAVDPAQAAPVEDERAPNYVDLVLVSPDVADFLRTLLNGLTLSTSAPDFDTTAEMVIRARRELAERPPLA